MKIFRTDQVSILNRIKYLSIAICILFTTNLLAQDTTPPSAPKNLISTNITEISFTLSWDASTDNVGIDHYEVYKDGAKIGDVSSTTIEVIGLTANTSYAMSVLAKDAAKNYTWNTAGLKVKTISLADIPKVRTQYIDPKDYPDFQRRKYPTPTWASFDNKVQFVAGRYINARKWENLDSKFGPKGDRPIAPRWWTDHGNVFRPGIAWFVGATNNAATDTDFQLAMQRMKDQGIYMHNIGGYGPGSPMSGSFGMYRQPEDYNAYMQSYLGDKFVGFDIGEQDGRYLFTLKALNTVNNEDRFKQYLNVHRYFERIGNDLGNKTVLLSVTWNWHYPAKNGNVYMLGAESQPKSAVTSSSVNYMMLRGASRQYGIMLYGDVSVFNTDGSKGYGAQDANTGPTKGNSLSLMRRLMVSEYLYNSAILGIETGQFEKPFPTSQTITPIGELQEQMLQFVKNNPRAGVMHAPVAILQDFLSGWIPKAGFSALGVGIPSTFGVIPWNLGDWQTHRVIEKILPRYDQNGLGDVEEGGYCNTPYGDMADGILTDASQDILNQYGLVVLTSRLNSVDHELKDKLNKYLEQAGNLIVTAKNAQDLFPEWLPNDNWITLSSPKITFLNGSSLNETGSYKLFTGLNLPTHTVLASTMVNGVLTPVIVKISVGKGNLILVLSDYGVRTDASYSLLGHYDNILDQELKKQTLFSVSNAQLGYITNRIDQSTYTVGIFNNSLAQKPFNITSNVGTISQITEIDLTAGRTHLKNQEGYFPELFQSNNGGTSSPTTIMGGDVRLFKVTLAKTPPVNEVNTVNIKKFPVGRYLYLPELEGAEEYLLKNKTLLDHFEGVMIDWTALANKDESSFKEKVIWLNLQNLKVVIDFSRGFDPYLQSLAQEGKNTNLQQIVSNTFGKMSSLFGKNSTNAVIKIETTGKTPNQLLNALDSVASWAAKYKINLNLYPGTSTNETDVLALVNSLTTNRSKLNVKCLLETSSSNDIQSSITSSGDKLGAVLITPETLAKNYASLQNIDEKVIQIINAPYVSWDDLYDNISSIYNKKEAVSLKPGTDKPLVSDILGSISDNFKVNPLNSNHYLALREISDLKQEVLNISDVFFNYFEGVMIEAKYLANKDDLLLANEKRWLDSKGIKVIVDFSHELNNYPDLTLIQYGAEPSINSNLARTKECNDYIDKVLNKCLLLGVKEVVIGAHNGPENDQGLTTDQQLGIKRLVQQAQTKGIKVHYQHNEFNTLKGGDVYNTLTNVKNIISGLRTEGFTNLFFATNSINANKFNYSASPPLGAIIIGGSQKTNLRMPIPINKDTEINISGLLAEKNTPQILDGGYELNKTALKTDVKDDAIYLGWTNQPISNNVPIISSVPKTNTVGGDNYSYTIQATDTDKDNLVYSALNLPSWLTFNPTTRVLSGKAPTNENGNEYLVRLRVFDGTIDVEQQFRIIMQVASSTKEIGLNPKILAYPNPTKNMITLLYPAGLPKVQLIKIVDTLGKELQVINNPIFKETLLEIKLNDQIANGLIILWFIDSNGKTIANKKILVQ